MAVWQIGHVSAVAPAGAGTGTGRGATGGAAAGTGSKSADAGRITSISTLQWGQRSVTPSVRSGSLIFAPHEHVCTAAIVPAPHLPEGARSLAAPGLFL